MRPLLPTLVYFAAVAALVLLKPFDAIGWTPCLVLGAGASVLFVVVNAQVARAARDDLRNTPIDLLEASIWSVDAGYLDVLGRSNPIVVEYLHIVAQRDLDAFATAWPRIEAAFYDLESAWRRRHHAPPGRPLTMDFVGKKLEIEELLRRRASATAGARTPDRSADS